MPNRFNYYFKCSNCKLKFTLDFILKTEIRFNKNYNIKELTKYVNANSKACINCQKYSDWIYVTKGSF